MLESKLSDRSEIFQTLNVRRRHLREQIADSVQDLIARNRLQLGDRLPSERELAKHLRVSRGTVREAIRLLEQRGLVAMWPGSGTFVAEVTHQVVADSMERYFVCGTCSHRDLIAVREILEPQTTGLAAESALPEDLASLRRLVDEIEGSFRGADVDRYASADADFHVALAVASHNELLIAITSGLHRIMLTWIEAQSKAYRLEEGARSHREVHDAVGSRDPERARRAMRVHMRAMRSALLE